MLQENIDEIIDSHYVLAKYSDEQFKSLVEATSSAEAESAKRIREENKRELERLKSEKNKPPDIRRRIHVGPDVLKLK